MWKYLARFLLNSEHKREQDESRQAYRECVFGVHILEVERRMEAKTTGCKEGKALRESQRDSLQKKSGVCAAGLHIHEAESGAEGMD